MMLDELDTFIQADLDNIIDFKKQFVRRYREVELKQSRSAAKMQQINEKMQLAIRYIQDNNQLINQLKGQVTSLEGQADGVQGKIDELHEFCKVILTKIRDKNFLIYLNICIRSENNVLSSASLAQNFSEESKKIAQNTTILTTGNHR